MPRYIPWLLRKSTLLLFLLLMVAVAPSVLQFDSSDTMAQSSPDMSHARVAIYDVQRNDNYSFTACTHMFRWMNATVEHLNGTAIQQGALRYFDLLVLPAFAPSAYQRELTPLGKERIRQFLATGGSLFSVCHGTVFVVTSLGIIDATLHYVGPSGVQCHDHHTGELKITEMRVNQASAGPDLSEEPPSYMVFTSGASYFEFHDNTNIIPILSYADTGLLGVIAFRYGQGTVLLSSPHPEFEEGDDRDGLSQDHITHWPTYQNLQDPDSEWNLMYKVSCWLVHSSPGVPIELYTGLLALIGGSFAVLFVVLLVYDLRKRKR
ncbi:MAG: hypothetical protein ACFE9O_03205 [Promethearchaeota archaeon]